MDPKNNTEGLAYSLTIEVPPAIFDARFPTGLPIIEYEFDELMRPTALLSEQHLIYLTKRELRHVGDVYPTEEEINIRFSPDEPESIANEKAPAKRRRPRKPVVFK